MKHCLEKHTMPDGTLDAPAVRRCIRFSHMLCEIELAIFLGGMAIIVLSILFSVFV